MRTAWTIILTTPQHNSLNKRYSQTKKKYMQFYIISVWILHLPKLVATVPFAKSQSLLPKYMSRMQMQNHSVDILPGDHLEEAHP